jgi:hypothetical protein
MAHTDGTLSAHSDEVQLRGIEAQIRWEAAGVERGVRRYREMLADSTLDQTPPGMSAIRDMMPAVVEAIAKAQEEARDAIATAGKGRQPDWWWLCQYLEAEKLAFITIQSALASVPRESGTDKRFTTLVLLAANGVRTQMDFEDWCAREREAKKAAKRAGEDRVDLLAVLKARVKVVDTKAWKRWAKKVQATRDEPWPEEAKIQLGTMLVELMVKHGGGWFEVANVPSQGKTERRLILTDLAKRAISDINQRQEVARPMRMPMIHPPKPWRREPKEAA